MGKITNFFKIRKLKTRLQELLDQHTYFVKYGLNEYSRDSWEMLLKQKDSDIENLKKEIDELSK